MRNLNETRTKDKCSNEIEMRRRLFRYFPLESERILISEADNTRLDQPMTGGPERDGNGSC